MIPVVIDGAGSFSAALAADLGQLGWFVEGAGAANANNVVPDHLVIVASADLTAVVQRVRASSAPATVIIVDGGVGPALDSHVLVAAIEPLAIEAAPHRRICGVDMRPAANPADLAAAVDFLLRACSVTGQILRIDPRAAID